MRAISLMKCQDLQKEMGQMHSEVEKQRKQREQELVKASVRAARSVLCFSMGLISTIRIFTMRVVPLVGDVPEEDEEEEGEAPYAWFHSRCQSCVRILTKHVHSHCITWQAFHTWCNEAQRSKRERFVEHFSDRSVRHAWAIQKGYPTPSKAIAEVPKEQNRKPALAWQDTTHSKMFSRTHRTVIYQARIYQDRHLLIEILRMWWGCARGSSMAQSQLKSGSIPEYPHPPRRPAGSASPTARSPKRPRSAAAQVKRISERYRMFQG